jgi:hypothetical protein
MQDDRVVKCFAGCYMSLLCAVNPRGIDWRHSVEVSSVLGPAWLMHAGYYFMPQLLCL